MMGENLKPAKLQNSTLRIGVIGCGSFGFVHAKCWQQLPNVELAALCDIVPTRARGLALAFDSAAAPDIAQLSMSVDAVSIAVPPHEQTKVALECLDLGLHVLLEKPFGTDSAQARLLMHTACDRGLVLQAGYLERFDAALRHTVNALPDPATMTARRISRHRARTYDADPVLELMVHDIDHAIAIAGTAPLFVAAHSGHGADTGLVRASLGFAGGFTARLCAGFDSSKQSREITLASRSADRLELDLLSQTLSTRTGDVTLQANNPLVDQFSDFAQAVLTGAGALKGPSNAARVLKVAEQISQLIDGEAARALKITNVANG